VKQKLKPRLKSLLDFIDSGPSEKDCIKYLENVIWKGGEPVSPFNPTSKVYKCKDNKYKCSSTNRTFTARSASIFKNSNLPLKTWFTAFSIFVFEDISSCKLAKFVRVTQKTAWFIEHRLRSVFKVLNSENMLDGVVEIDETFIGGSNLNRHWDKKVPKAQGRNFKDKTPVWGAVKLGGNLIARVVPNTKKRTLEPLVRKYIKEGTTICTDEWIAYENLGKWYIHKVVNHRKKQYVNGEATTNRIENVWSHLKKMIYGTYFKISRKHAQRYVDEFAFRRNTQKYTEQEKFDLAFSSSVGKSLCYRELISAGC
jgi:transposase-like protein/IS1 family transposase